MIMPQLFSTASNMISRLRKTYPLLISGHIRNLVIGQKLGIFGQKRFNLFRCSVWFKTRSVFLHDPDQG